MIVCRREASLRRPAHPGLGVTLLILTSSALPHPTFLALKGYASWAHRGSGTARRTAVERANEGLQISSENHVCTIEKIYVDIHRRARTLSHAQPLQPHPLHTHPYRARACLTIMVQHLRSRMNERGHVGLRTRGYAGHCQHPLRRANH